MDNILSSEMAIAEIEKLESRKAELETSMEEKRASFEDADIETRDAILSDVEEQKKEFDSIDDKIAELKEIRDKYKEQEEKMSLMENVKNVEVKKTDYRSTPEYADVWKRYVLSDDDREIRAFTTATTATTGVSNGGILVPTIMQQYVETAWESNELLNRVSISNVAGYFAVPLEVEADPAVWHTENGDPVTEEDVTLADVMLKPKMIKKFISWTDELEAMTSAQFMEYLRDEVVYRVLNLLATAIVSGTLDASGNGVLGIASDIYNASTNVKGAQTVDGAITFNSVNEGVAKLSTFDNLAVAMNQATFFSTIMGMTDLQQRPIFQIATDNAGKPRYFVNGIPVIFTNALPAYSASLSANTAYAIVGNFRGYKLNLPEGRNVITLIDPYTLATSDKKRLIARIFAAGAITRIGHFAVLRTGA